MKSSPAINPAIISNRESADRHGWTPALFGADGFNDLLTLKIREFQKFHILRETGIVDDPTAKAIRGISQGLADKAHLMNLEQNLHGLGSVARYDPNDESVVRSSVFAGSLVVCASVDEVDFVRKHFRGTLLASPVGVCRLTLSTGQSVFPIAVLGTSEDPTVQGRALGSAVTEAGADGGILHLGSAWPWVSWNEGNPLDDFVDGFREACPRQGIAVMSGLLGRGMSKEEKRAWSHCREFDAALPIVPGRWGHVPVEYSIGQTVAEWSIYGQIRPSFCFPIIRPEEWTTVNEIHRFRDWARDRGLRGIGYAGQVDESELLKAYNDPIPDVVDRIDYF